MTEFTIALNLPLRAVIAGGADSPPPDWLQREHYQLPFRLADQEAARKRESESRARDREVLELQRQREAWAKGLMKLDQALLDCRQKWDDAQSELRSAAVELAHAIACKLVFRQLEQGTFPIDHLVEEVLSRMNSAEAVTVRLHPDDLVALQNSGKLPETTPAGSQVRVLPDSKLARGDCQAVAGDITLIYELRRQVDELRRELLSTVNGHAEP